MTSLLLSDEQMVEANVPTFGAQRQNMNFFDGQGLFGLNVVDRVGQSKHKAIYNHLLLFYGVLIIL